MKSALFLLFCAILNVHAWVALIPNNLNKAPPGGCYADNNNIGYMDKNEVKRIQGMCAIAKCQGSFIEMEGCGSVSFAPPCKKLPGDLRKPFPHCCYEKICPEEPETDIDTFEVDNLLGTD
ncbi:unnamed protein product [Phyllotreta striolata]|uniref:Single domain-containing protein n=1 Tax=Phyllotreta striolata TaxID=444603 RepID=A0A9N9TEM7_PHYSR|nr:unnamed protein product [Phyllotreta striolata]